MSETGAGVVLGRPDNEWLALACVVAAVWRITHLFMYETGPFFILERLRALTGVRHDEDSRRPIGYPKGNVFECFWCFSVWVSIFIIPFVLWAWPVIYVAAFSAAAIWIETRGTIRN